MAIALGQHVAAAGASVTSVTTAAVTSAATGSTFWVGAGTTGTYAATAFTDSKSNTYTQNGSDVGGLGTARRARKVNGTGGASHTFTVSTTASAVTSIWAIEITGADTTESLDQQAGQLDTSATPWDSPSVTTTTANELLVGFGLDDSSGDGDSFTSNLSFTNTDTITTGATHVTGVSATKIVSATGGYTYQCTSTQATQMIVCIDTFKEAGGGGGGRTTKNTRAFPLGTEIGMGWVMPTQV